MILPFEFMHVVTVVTALAKVLNIWEGQKYFSEAVLQQINHVIDKAKVSPDNPPPAKPLDEPQKGTPALLAVIAVA